MHQNNHAATGLEAGEGYRQLRCLQAMSLTVLSIRRDLMGAKDTALASGQVELLA